MPRRVIQTSRNGACSSSLSEHPGSTPPWAKEYLAGYGSTLQEHIHVPPHPYPGPARRGRQGSFALRASIQTVPSDRILCPEKIESNPSKVGLLMSSIKNANCLTCPGFASKHALVSSQLPGERHRPKLNSASYSGTIWTSFSVATSLPTESAGRAPSGR